MPYKRANRYIGCVRKKGFPRQHKTFQKKRDARNWEIETEKNLSLRKPETRTAYLIRMWVNEYLSYSEKFSIKTYKEKKSIMGRFCQMVNIDDPATIITPDIALNYLKKQFKERGGNAANKDRKNLVAGWQWGRTFKKFGVNPFQIVPKFPEKRQSRYVPPEKDFWKAYEAEEGQDRVLLLAYLHTAARRTELFQLRWEDVDFGDSRIRLWTRKREDGSQEYDWLPMTNELYNSLLTHKQTAQNEWVFPNSQTGKPYFDRIKWMRGLCNKAGVKYFGVHAIRHLTASILAKEGIPLILIQGILRHKKLSTTERYVHRLSDLKPALTVLGKRGNIVYVSPNKKSDDFMTTLENNGNA